MRIKIPSQELNIGMHVEELDRPWLETPFLFQGFVIETEEELEQLREYTEYVYISAGQTPSTTTYGPQFIRTPVATEMRVQEAPSEAAMVAGLNRLWILQGQRRKQDAEVIFHTHYKPRATVEKELPKAEKNRIEVRRVIDNMYQDARMGKSVETGYAKEVISDLTESVLRNADAHTLLTQLRKQDVYAASHSMNVCSLSLAFGRHLGIDRQHLLELGLGAMLVDVGNIRIPQEILYKAGPLTKEEFDIVRRHPAFGMEILLNNPAPPPAPAIEIVYAHHERMDGSGYPRGLIRSQIPLLARIVAIIDAYDALTTKRSYRDSVAPSDALRDLYNSRRGHFDEPLVEQFIQFLGIYPLGSILQCSSNEIGIVIAQNPERRLRPKLLLVRDALLRPYPVPRILDLSKSTGEKAVEIVKILKAEDYGIDIGEYIQDLKSVPETIAH